MAMKWNGQSWEEVYSNPSETSQGSNRPSTVAQSTQNTPPALTDVSNRESTEATNNSSGDFLEVEQSVLVGDMNIIPRPSHRAKATVLLQNLGNYLTGLYFVDKVTHTFNNSDGYSQSMSVSRNGFGTSLKSGSATKPIGQVASAQGGLVNGTADTSRPVQAKPVATKVASTTYTIKSGDSLWKIAQQFYGNGSLYTKIFNANKSIIKNANLIYPGQKITIPPK